MEEQSDARCRAQSNNCSGDGLSCKTVRHCGISLKVTDIWRPSLSQSEIFRFFSWSWRWMINTQYMFDVTFLVVVACVICSWHFRFSISNDWLRWMARSTKATGRMVGSTTRVSYDCQMVLAMILGREEQQQPSVKYFKNHGNGSRSQFIFHSPLFVQKKRNTLDMIYIYIYT